MQEELSGNKLAVMPMGRLIATMSLPAIFSMTIQALYNVVDSIFVARVSDAALTAVSLAYPLQMLLIAVAVGTGVGLNSLISRRLGEQNKADAEDAASHGLVLAVISGLVFALIGLFAARPFLSMFTNNREVLDMSVTYARIVLILSVFSMISVAIEKTLQGTGNMVIPMVQNLSGAVTNIILDPILIFGLLGAPKLGVAGAALATVIGQVVGMVVGLIVLFGLKHDIKVTFKGFRWHGETVRQIYQVGAPAIVMQSVVSVMTAFMNVILIAFSETAVAVLGVYFKVQSFVFMPVFGLTQGALPVMGFNYGAHNKKRLFQAYKITLITACCFMVAGLILFQLIPDRLLMLFNDSADLQGVGVPAFRTISLSFVGAAFGIVNSTLFQAVGRGMASLLVSVMRQIIVIIPAAYFFGQLWGLSAVWFSFPLAEIVAFIVSYLLLFRMYRLELQYLKPRSEMMPDIVES